MDACMRVAGKAWGAVASQKMLCFKNRATRHMPRMQTSRHRPRVKRLHNTNRTENPRTFHVAVPPFLLRQRYTRPYFQG
ncbi:hypothetical protein GW17_00012811 [Ensete ventricosum]|nr:hypothetical protein GW17_00012811 [Ensete ventricosum]